MSAVLIAVFTALDVGTTESVELEFGAVLLTPYPDILTELPPFPTTILPSVKPEPVTVGLIAVQVVAVAVL